MMQSLSSLKELPKLSPRRFEGTCAYVKYHPLFSVDDDQPNWYVCVIYVIVLLTSSGATRLWRPADEQLLISQERKRKTIETSDGVMTVTAAKRRRKLPSEIEREQGKGETRRDFLAKFT
jgi:hypothetical protein